MTASVSLHSKTMRIPDSIRLGSTPAKLKTLQFCVSCPQDQALYKVSETQQFDKFLNLGIVEIVSDVVIISIQQPALQKHGTARFVAHAIHEIYGLNTIRNMREVQQHLC